MARSPRSASLSAHERKLLFLPGLILICTALFSTSTESNISQAQREFSRPVEKNKTLNKRKGRNCSPPGDQEIYTPLIDLTEAQAGEIVFNSRSPEAMDVTPTFYKRDGTAVVGDPVRVQSAEIRYVNVKKLLPKHYQHERDWGGLSLSYHGVNREMWAQFRFLRVNGGGNVDEFFIVTDESRSTLLEAVWWMPKRSEAIIALGNITDLETRAKLSFSDGHTRTINLKPHQTELVRDIHHNQEGTESLRIAVEGAPGSIVPTGIITSKDGSFNSVIRFYSPEISRQPHLYANGFRVTETTPHMVLKNTTSVSIMVQPEFIPFSGRATGETLTLPQLNLGPNEVTEIDLSPLQRAASHVDGLKHVTVQITNSGPPGSLIGSLYAINETTKVIYDVPLRDSGPTRTMTGSYPWKITDDFRTVVYVTNITDQDAQFISQINYIGGDLVFGPRTLLAGETAVFDLKELRNQQILDSAGNSLPKDASQGQFKWAVRGLTNGKLVLIGRSEMVSLSRNVSSSYSCNDPCPPYYAGSIDPFPPPIVVNGSRNAKVWETAYYDSGYIMGPYQIYASWSVGHPIATINPEAGHSITATGTQEGTSSLLAFIAIQQDYVWDGLNCYELGTYEEREEGPVDVVCAVPTNFRQTSTTSSSNGTLSFRYDWDSSTGTGVSSLADLSQCTIGEKVDYTASDLPFASPPFPSGISPPNPTVTEGSATGGFLEDNHSTPGTFVKPYSAKTITASQIYRYRCTCKDNNAWITLLGPLSITRSVSQNTNGSWKFTITKSGQSATINPLP